MINQENCIERIKKCGDQILQNLVSECDWNDKMIQAEEEAEFEEVVINRSKESRRFYKENEECIRELEKYMESITDETADALYEVARTLYLNGRIDPGVICMIADPVIRYYKEHDIEEEKAIILSAIRFASAQDYYNRMVGYLHLEENLANAEWIISHKDNYCQYEDVRIRGNIFLAYTGAIIGYVSTHEPAYVPKMVELLNEARELWFSEDVQKLDGNNPGLIGISDNLNLYLPWEIGLMYADDEDVFEQMLYICEEFCIKKAHEDLWDEKFMAELIHIRKWTFYKKITVEDAIKTIISKMENLPKPDWDNDPQTSQCILQSFGISYICVMRMMVSSEIPFEEREKIVVKLNGMLDDTLAGMPYQYNNAYISSLVHTFFKEALPNVKDFDLVETMINDLMLRRQPSTFFHSLMVEDISALIAEEMIAKAPELFATLPDYESAQDVIADKENLINVIRRAARIHDLGKCAIAPVIMQQSRKINDDEFECIKTHPDAGANFLYNLGGYKKYRDVIRGHHKTYDGKGGYPATFDNTASPYKILIDLISISDSTDAATDLTGRNYTEGKDFAKLLSELNEGAGTRYNPDIVQIIDDSPELIARLSDLTGKERISHLYEVYHGMR